MESRITELEIRLTHLENTIEVLDDTVIKQRDEIDILKVQINELNKKLKATQATIIAPESEETPPPHY